MLLSLPKSGCYILSVDNNDKHLLAKIGQYILITNESKQVLLLQRRQSNIWSLPGGRINKNDKDWISAIAREIEEETRLSVENLKPFDIKLIEDPYQMKYCVFFTASCRNTDNLKISQEHISSKWVSSYDIKQMVIDDEPKVRLVLEHYFSERLASG